MSEHLIKTRAFRPAGPGLAVSIALLAFTAGTAHADVIRAAADSGAGSGQATGTPPDGVVLKQIAVFKWAPGKASPTPPPPPPPPPPK
jgi:hypothetical protein